MPKNFMTTKPQSIERKPPAGSQMITGTATHH
jgi:hypothetical protein